MKRTKAIILIAAIACILTGCGAKSADISSAEDITIEKLIEKTTPADIVEQYGVFKSTAKYQAAEDSVYNGAEVVSVFAKEGEIYKVSQKMNYADGYMTNIYMSNDPEDPKFYFASTGGNESADLRENEVEDIFGASLLNYSGENAAILSVEEKDKTFVVTLELKSEGEVSGTDELVIDPESGNVLSVVKTYADDGEEGDTTCTFHFEYAGSLKVDESARTECETNSTSDKLIYDTEDINGNPVTSDDLHDAKLVLVNFWEPWCGPCVGEMPDLQKLYDNYKDQGFVLVGVYSTLDMQEDAEAIMKDIGITYPLIKMDQNLKHFTTDYVPVSYLFDGEGNLLGEAYGGARSYEDWEEIVKAHLN